MLNFFKKSKLEFISLIPELVETMPIEKASNTSFEWIKNMANSFAAVKQQASLADRVRHIARCPGIASVSRYGYIQKSYQDIYIKTNGSRGVEWKTALDQTLLITEPSLKFPYVGHHILQDAANFGILKPNTLSTIIKIQSPWVVKIPKGYYLLCLPIPYHDDNRFTATMGLLDADAGINYLNVQLYWHCLNSEEVIPAGTPLAQYILIKKDKITANILGVTTEHIKELRKLNLVLDAQFNKANYGKLKRF